MSGFEIIGAVAAGLQFAEVAFNILKRIKQKIKDESALRELKNDCEAIVTNLADFDAGSSPQAQVATRRLQTRLQAIIESIGGVQTMKWYAKIANLFRIWNSDFLKELEIATDLFRTFMVLETANLLCSIKLQQEKLTTCITQGLDDIIGQDTPETDVIIHLIRMELSDLDMNDKLLYLEQIREDLEDHLQKLEIAQQAANRTLRTVSRAVFRIEKGVELTHQEVLKQRGFLLDLQSMVAAGFQQLSGSLAAAGVMSPVGLPGHEVTYETYVNFWKSKGEYLPEVEIWDGIRDVTYVMCELMKTGYLFPEPSIGSRKHLKEEEYDQMKEKTGECKIPRVD
jgi:hypothetical protein